MPTEVSAGRLVLALDDEWRISVTDTAHGELLGAPDTDTPRDMLRGIGVQRLGDVSPRRSRAGASLGPGGPDDELAPPDGKWDEVASVTSVRAQDAEEVEGAAGAASLMATLRTARGRAVDLAAHAARDDVVEVMLSTEEPETVEALGIAWSCTRKERWLGFGERSDSFLARRRRRRVLRRRRPLPGLRVPLLGPDRPTLGPAPEARRHLLPSSLAALDPGLGPGPRERRARLLPAPPER